MPKCDLRIELDRSNGNYQPGESVTGLVRVTVDGKVKCKSLSVTRIWRTHGKGNRASGEEHAQSVFQGEWLPGTHSYSFEFLAPEGPFTHHGKLLNLDWYVEVRADIPWALDPKEKTEFFVTPKSDRQVDLRRATVAKAKKEATVMGCILIAGFMAMFLYFLGLSIRDDYVFAGEFFVVVAIALGVMLHKHLGRRALSRLDLALTRPGTDTLRADLRYETTKTLNSVTTALVVEEVVEEGTGTDRETHHERIREVIDHNAVVDDGHMLSTFKIPNPDEVGWPIEVDSNKLVWFLEVKFDIASWPDHTEIVPLELNCLPADDLSPYRGHL